MEVSETIWNLIQPKGVFWNHKELYGTIRSLMEPEEALLNHKEHL